MAFNPAQIIADWHAAYELAHGFKSAEAVTYERGWFVFMARGYPLRRRRFDVEEMTKRCLHHAASKAPRP